MLKPITKEFFESFSVKRHFRSDVSQSVKDEGDEEDEEDEEDQEDEENEEDKEDKEDEEEEKKMRMVGFSKSYL